ncbi:MAG: rhodanese-like domain-containing protein [Desulfovibrionaceae bacterium]|nr:rhodanese-like domain-containing protein [Desulfovibrionaceae bacterium]
MNTTDALLTADEFANMQLSDDAIILDVRTQEEWNAGHVKGAIHIDYLDDSFESNLEPLDKNKHYYVYCRSGMRSAQAIHTMQQLGFERCTNIVNGIIGIQRTNIELEK